MNCKAPANQKMNYIKGPHDHIFYFIFHFNVQSSELNSWTYVGYIFLIGDFLTPNIVRSVRIRNMNQSSPIEIQILKQIPN